MTHLWCIIKRSNYVKTRNAISKSHFIPTFKKRELSSTTQDHRKLLEFAEKQLNIKNEKDWYSVSKKNLSDVGLKNLDHLDLVQILHNAYPDYDWHPWMFSHCPTNYWDDIDNQKRFLQTLEKRLNIKEPTDWYNVSFKDIRDFGGNALLSKYHSLSKMITRIFPEYQLSVNKFEKSSLWAEKEYQLSFVETIANKLKIKELSDWYNVSNKDFIDCGGGYLLSTYGNSISTLLIKLYPNYEWLPWKFTRTPVNFWDDITNQRKYMDWLFKKWNMKDISEWYEKLNTLTANEVEGGNLLQRKYNNSTVSLLLSVYPDYDWLPWKFPKSPQFYWDKKIVQQQFMNRTSKKLNVKGMSDWYSINPLDFIELGGGLILLSHGGSMNQLLPIVYPNYEWIDDKFVNKQDIWSNESVAKCFVEWLAKTPDAIPYLSYCFPRFDKQGSLLVSLLSQRFPENKWGKPSTLSYKKSQYILKEQLKKMFSTEEALEEYRHPDITTALKAPLELDLFYPKYNLAFEYQGLQHFKGVNVYHRKGSFDENKLRDTSKAAACKEAGITLIEIPYWWNRDYASLYATVYNARPELFSVPPTTKPIPQTPPSKQQIAKEKATKNVFMTATEWEESMDPTGWWMSEKFDGVRLYWNGFQFYSRSGEKIEAPKSITSQLPQISLDGELWTQYGLYQDAVNLLRSKNEDKWNGATFWVFDTPKHANVPFEERIQILKDLKDLPNLVKIIDFVKCKGKEHLKEYASNILSNRGEGVVLRQQGSLYEATRSTSLRKYKPYLDTEVKVLKNQYPHGFSCQQLNNGKTVFINIKLKDSAEEAKKVKEGSIITVKYLGTNKYGTLQYPQFYRERLDVNWEDLNK